MKDWYDKKISVANYISRNYMNYMNEPINDSLKNYFLNLGLTQMNLKSFVCKFKLQDSSYKDLLKFVLDENNIGDIMSHYTQILYSTVEYRKSTSRDDYDYVYKKKF